MRRHSLTNYMLLVAVAIAGCNDAAMSRAERGGTVVIATTADANSLFPPLVGSTTGRQVTEQVYDYLTEVGPSLNTVDDKTFARRLAKAWTWSPDSMSLSVQIEPSAKWHDGQPVRASDVAYTFRTYCDTALGSPMRSQLASIDSVSVADSVTAVFWFNKRYPLQFYDATSQMQVIPEHVFGSTPPDSLRERTSSMNPVGSGRYRFASWKSGESIELRADTANYRGAPHLTRLIWRVFPEPQSAVTALLTGDVDVVESLSPDNARKAQASDKARVIVSPGADYIFLAFNFNEPQSKGPHHLFASRELRRALSMAVDRAGMVKNVFDTLAVPGAGPTIRSFPSTSSTLNELPFDPESASRLLDSLGWKLETEKHVRTKNGEELRFRILVPASSAYRKRMGVLLQEQLRKIGVGVDLDIVEYGTFAASVGKRDFDAALLSWHLGTSPASVRELWTSEAATEDGNNTGSYRSPVFDASVDSAVTAFDQQRSTMFYNRAYQTAIDDAPAIWLYELKLILGVNKRIKTSTMRPDAWWYSLGDWQIPRGEQIDRDRIN